MDKSKYTEVGGGLNVDKMWSDKDNPLKVGQSIEGRYGAKHTGVGDRGSNVYVLELSDGRTIGVWGGTVIDSRFSKIAEGKMVGIEFLGKAKTKDGKSTYNNFWVGVGINVVGDEGGAQKPMKSLEEDFADVEEVNADDLPF